MLGLTIIAWALMLSYYIYSSYIGLDTLILPMVFAIISIIGYRNCYIKNIKYVADNLGIKAYDSKGNLLSKNTWSENYEVKRTVLTGVNRKTEDIICEINFNDNSYIFWWDSAIVKKLSDYCNVDEALEEQSESNKSKLIWTIISMIILFIIIKSNIFHLY